MCAQTDTHMHILEHKAAACQDDGSKDELDKTKADVNKHRIRVCRGFQKEKERKKKKEQSSLGPLQSTQHYKRN